MANSKFNRLFLIILAFFALNCPTIWSIKAQQVSNPSNIYDRPLTDDRYPLEDYEIPIQRGAQIIRVKPMKTVEINGARALADRLIVKFKDAISDAEKSAIRREFSSKKGIEVQMVANIAPQTYVIDISGVASLQEAARLFQDDARIEYAEPDFIVEEFEIPNDPSFDSQYGLNRIAAPSAWNITRSSSGVKVAVLDSGIFTSHLDLTGKVINRVNFSASSTTDDLRGHGTHVAGIVAANTNNGQGVAGTAYYARLQSVKVLDDTGKGSYSGIAQGIRWAADNGADVINMSLGGPGSCTALLQDAINYAGARNVVIVAAAGNTGSTALQIPASCSNVISVASTDQSDAKSSFSTYGTWVTVAAPGTNIASTYNNGGYVYLSGTSMATPYVSGIAAMLRSQPRCKSSAAIYNRITQSADQIGGTGSYWQYGRVNALRAVQGCLSPDIDFDGDNKTDLAVWHQNSGTWYIVSSSTSAGSNLQWGLGGDVPLDGDFDGDGKTDMIVWRPSTGYWFIVQSSTNTVFTREWGTNGDKPLVGDYDGDGKTDLAVWRPSSGYWYIRRSSNDTVSTAAWGLNGDVPRAGDYDGDGKTDRALWRPSNATWYIARSSNNTAFTVQWGTGGDLPLAGDYDGDSKTDVAVWRPSTGNWFIVPSASNSVLNVAWGDGSDVPISGDYDGDGKTDIAVWRPSDGYWYVRQSSNGATYAPQWGGSGFIPIGRLRQP